MEKLLYSRTAQPTLHISTLHSQLIKWYDHEAHTHFDVCADDHCQRYQGITRASTPQAIELFQLPVERC